MTAPIAAVAQNLLVTARPGEGKTTLVRRLASRLADLAPAGFYTEEIRRHERRVGFRLVGLDGSEGVLAHVDLPLPRRVGPYGVDVRALDAFLAGLRTEGSELLLVDEIGKMECVSPRFRGLVHHWLDGPAVVVATVAERGEGLISEVKRRADCELHELTCPGAEALLDLLAAEVRRRVTTPDDSRGTSLGPAPEPRRGLSAPNGRPQRSRKGPRRG